MKILIMYNGKTGEPKRGEILVCYFLQLKMHEQTRKYSVHILGAVYRMKYVISGYTYSMALLYKWERLLGNVPMSLSIVPFVNHIETKSSVSLNLNGKKKNRPTV